jgi:hypothetical protein
MTAFSAQEIMKEIRKYSRAVIPAQAGIHCFKALHNLSVMTGRMAVDPGLRRDDEFFILSRNKKRENIFRNFLFWFLAFVVFAIGIAVAAPNKKWAYDRDMQDVLKYVNPDCSLQQWLVDHPFELGKYRAYAAQNPCVPETQDAPADAAAPAVATDDNPILSAYRKVQEVEKDFNLSGWTTKDGKFNGLRLGADIAGGALVAAAAGLLTHKVMKDKQLKDGRESVQCEIRGEPRAGLGETFVIK